MSAGGKGKNTGGAGGHGAGKSAGGKGGGTGSLHGSGKSAGGKGANTGGSHGAGKSAGGKGGNAGAGTHGAGRSAGGKGGGTGAGQHGAGRSPGVLVNGIHRTLIPHHPRVSSEEHPVLPLPAPGEPGHEPPPRASLRAKCPPVLEQAPIGSCAAFAFTSALRFLHLKDGRDERLSPLFCYWVSRVVSGDHPYADSGCRAPAVVAALKKYGVCVESAWPYHPHKFAEQPPEAAFEDAARRKLKSALRVPTLRAIKQSIADGFPVVVEFPVTRSMDEGIHGRPSPGRKTGRFPLPSDADPSDGLHYVLAVGYDDAKGHVEVENSWGPDFGKRGFGYLDYAFFGDTQDTPIADPKVKAVGPAWTLRFEADELPAQPTRGRRGAGPTPRDGKGRSVGANGHGSGR